MRPTATPCPRGHNLLTLFDPICDAGRQKERYVSVPQCMYALALPFDMPRAAELPRYVGQAAAAAYVDGSRCSARTTPTTGTGRSGRRADREL